MSNNNQKTEDENIEEKIRLIFSTNYMLNCFREGNELHYMKFFNIPKIKKLFTNQELINSIIQYLANDLVISKTSRNSFMHRNTLIYRIKKLHKIIGLNVNKFKDANIFNNMMCVKNVVISENEN
ncbi:MAG: helix-turn-helix domain-containing protein [Clostridia bacterium]|nr:helix-turn-helix domain-containing protein [Clostridia bacterium]MDD4685993.1 helix-turn-helix domain-containing protein [Clostridia bacterium]